eukprot:m.84006 g.84006  ORF g.84006 m.84006 type:complete len:111 (+) comp12140_c2_seq4:99-431(+)
MVALLFSTTTVLVLDLTSTIVPHSSTTTSLHDPTSSIVPLHLIVSTACRRKGPHLSVLLFLLTKTNVDHLHHPLHSNNNRNNTRLDHRNHHNALLLISRRQEMEMRNARE